METHPKNLILLCFLLIVFLTPITTHAGDWKVYIFGVDMDRLRNMSWTKVVSGVVLSVATHEAAHIACLKLNKKDHWIERRGFRPIIHSERLNHREGRWFSRAGFIAQLAIGTFLPKEWDFTAGWLGVTNYQLTYYGTDPIGDFRSIDRHGGDGEKEYQAFSLWVTLLGDRHIWKD